MLYADSSNVGTCCMLTIAMLVHAVCSELHSCFQSDGHVSPRTEHYPLLASEDDLLQSLGASRLKWHIPSKTSCSSVRFETESKGSREHHSLLVLCVTQCPTVVPCFSKCLLLCTFRFIPLCFP